MSDTPPSANLPVAHLGPMTTAGASTWEAIAQLATLVPPDRWAIVGGQMVAIHAALVGVEPPRVKTEGQPSVAELMNCISSASLASSRTSGAP